VPGLLKVKVKVWPLLKLPLAKALVVVALVDMSLAEITLWGTESLLVHVTVVPALTVRVWGVNA
jgi:hypothetical protein